MSKRERIAWLDVARGWSILSVAFYHSTLYLDEYGLAAGVFEDVNNVMLPVRMPLFFTVSGVLAASAVQDSWRKLVEKRLWVFVYLLLVWTTIRWVYFSSIQTNIRSPTEGSSLLELVSFWIAPSSGLWFIWALSIFFVLGKLGFHIRTLFFPLACGLAVLSYTDSLAIDNFAQRNVLRYAPFFLGGAWFGRDAVRWIVTGYKSTGIISALVFAGATALMMAMSGPLRGLVQVLASISGLALGASISIALTNNRLFKGPLSYIGRNTLPIYVSHVLIVTTVSASLAAVATELPMIDLWAVPLTTVVAVAVALLVEALCERAGMWWLYSAPALPAWKPKMAPHNSR